MKISCYMIVKNEAKRLGATLDAVRQVADEIVIVDSGSTDDTLKIAEKYTKNVFFHKWISYANQKNWAQNKCRYDWVLSLDADEVLSPALIAEIQSLKQKTPPFWAYNMKIADVFPGQNRPGLGVRKYNLIRLYHRDYATMRPDLMHKDRIALTKKTPVGCLRGLVYHFSYINISQTIAKLNWYTDQVVATAEKKGKRYSRLRLMFEFPWQFLRYYFVRRYCLGGVWGFFVAMNLAYFRYVRIAKCIEQQRIRKEKNA